MTDKPFAFRPRGVLRTRFEAFMKKQGLNANQAALKLLEAGLNASEAKAAPKAPRQPLPPTNPVRPAFEHPDPPAALAGLPSTMTLGGVPVVLDPVVAPPKATMTEREAREAFWRKTGAFNPKGKK